IRITIAAAEPITMAFFCWSAGSERAARAMTTALSPDNRIFTQMICSRATKKAADPNSTSISSKRRRARLRWLAAPVVFFLLQHGLEQLAHFRRILGRLDAAGFHDFELGLGRVGAAGNQRAGMSHALACRSRHARDEADHRLLHVVLGPLGGVHFV